LHNPLIFEQNLWVVWGVALDILSILFGSLLGDAGGEKRVHARFKFWHSAAQLPYLLWKHSILSTSGYCSAVVPLIRTRVPLPGQKGDLYAAYFWTYTYASLDWLYDAFYVNGVKRVPFELMELLLTPLALAVWAPK